MTEASLNVGAELQRAREARGLALSEVAQQLKFAPRQLEALEQDRFDLLPGGTFARGMVRNYARLLKIDPEPLVRGIGERFAAPDAGTLAARYSQPVPFSDSARRSTFVYLALSLGVLALGGAVAWQWVHERNKVRGQSAAVAHASRPAQVASAPKAKTGAPVARPKPPEPAVKTAPTELAASSEPSAAAAKVENVAVAASPAPLAKVAPGVHRLVIRCQEAAWVEVRDEDGTALISSLNPAGSERSVRARGPLNLVIGNARHVTVLHNDRPLDLAPYIKVETARLALP